MVDYINSINPATPTGKTNGDELDDELRALKDKIYNTLAALDGPVTATDTELNYLVGVTANLQTTLTALTNAISDLQSASYVRSGTVGSDGSAFDLPSGWSSAKIGTGQYRITHNLGLAVEKYAPSGAPITSSPYTRTGVVSAVTSNYFELSFYEFGTTLADVEFNFLLGVEP